MRHLAFLSSALLLTLAMSAQSPDAYKSDPKFQNALAEAKKLERVHQYTFAADAYKKASKIAGGKDIVCLNDLYNLQFKIASYKDAAQTASAMLAIAATPSDRSISESNRGLALFQQAGDKGKPELLQAAHESFQAAIADNAKNATAHFYDGKTLARLNQLDAASAQFKACLSCLTPKDSSYVRAQHFAANPSLSLAKMAPAFSVTALDGSHFNLDEMGGRVVLIDFWATWCGPCNRELPHMKKIAQEFASEPLVIISVSWDSDETKWKDFIAKNGMTWVQYRDVDHSLSTAFGINAIPHYFTIDSDGVLTAEMMGEGSNVEGKLKKLIAKAKVDREKVQVAAASSGN
ncbi:MAG TPA: TlpA disulfide reductase family protein [Edaphobacter sp.]|nr:TlpA disulfide reductase family protein [Edaphobacter sp.]